MSLYRQIKGTVLGFGAGGLSLFICAQSGLVFVEPRSERSLSAESLVGLVAVTVSVVVIFVKS